METFRTEKIDLVLTDFNMPMKDGLDLLNEIRKTNKNIKVLLLASTDDMKGKSVAGFSEVIKKPVKMVEMIRVVKSYL
jgi:YesN/AraC family two-component response regulator